MWQLWMATSMLSWWVTMCLTRVSESKDKVSVTMFWCLHSVQGFMRQLYIFTASSAWWVFMCLTSYRIWEASLHDCFVKIIQNRVNVTTVNGYIKPFIAELSCASSDLSETRKKGLTTIFSDVVSCHRPVDFFSVHFKGWISRWARVDCWERVGFRPLSAVKLKSHFLPIQRNDYARWVRKRALILVQVVGCYKFCCSVVHGSS